MVSVSGIEVKFGRIAAFAAIIGGVIVVYSLYRSNRTPEVTNDKDQIISPPQQQACNVEVGGKPALDVAKPVVLLLHGQKFSTSTWKEIGTLTRLAEWGYQAVAVNITQCSLPDDLVLKHVFDKIGNPQNVIIVSPSFSGKYTGPVVASLDKCVKAYIAIAPVLATAVGERLEKVMIPTLVVFGDKDESFNASSSLVALKKIVGVQTKVIADAGHACYKDKPDDWHEVLKHFLEALPTT